MSKSKKPGKPKKNKANTLKDLRRIDKNNEILSRLKKEI